MDERILGVASLGPLVFQRVWALTFALSEIFVLSLRSALTPTGNLQQIFPQGSEILSNPANEPVTG